MVDFLSWSVHNPHTEYAISDIGGVQDRGAVGTVLDLDTNYDPGIRISAGRRLFGSAVEGRFTYTYFDSFTNERFDGPVRSTFISSDNSENDDSDNINTSGVETIFADDRATRAVASLDFDYNTFDWEVAQAVNLTQSLAMRLSGKFRYLNMNQDFRVTYTGGDFQTAFTPFETNAYDGGGIILGSEIRWYLTNSLSIRMAGNGGMMMGVSRTRIFIPDDEPGVPTDVRNTETVVSPMMDITAAVNYTRQVGSYELNFGAGIEMSHYFNLVDGRTFSDSHQEGQNVHQLKDLSLGGAFIRFGVNQ